MESGYRLPRERLQEDIDAILSTGVKVNLSVEIGTDYTIEELSRNFDSIYILLVRRQTSRWALMEKTAEVLCLPLSFKRDWR